MKRMLVLLLFSSLSTPLLSGDSSPAASRRNLPLAFEPNVGQAGPEVRYLARGPGYTVFLTGQEAVFLYRGNTVDSQPLRIQFVGGMKNPQMESRRALAGVNHYFIGDDPSAWHTNIPTASAVRYYGVYPGIDVDFYGNLGRPEFDFLVNPGADPRTIRLAIEGTSRPRLDRAGNLVLPVSGGELRLLRPVAYQDRAGTRQSIQAGFVIDRSGRIGFRVGAYDRKKPLVIDPVLTYSTYLGGSGFDQAYAIAVDAEGNTYITGQTGAANFPTTAGAFQGSISPGGYTDAFVTKLNPQGTAAIYSTFLGGFGPDTAYGIAVDASGSAYVTGEALSFDFPVTPGAFQSAMRGGFDVFVTRLNSQGSALIYSTLLGGSFDDFPRGIALDAVGNAYLTGWTKCAAPSCDFPVQNAFQPLYGGGYNDAFVTKLNADGSALVYSTYLGGGRELNSADDWGDGIAVDLSGSAYVTGYTSAPDFPVTPGAYDQSRGGFDAFVTKFSPDGRSLVYSTFLGGIRRELGLAIAVDGTGHAFVVGSTESQDFPVTAGAFQTTGSFEAFLTKLNPQGSGVVYSTFLGGAGGVERGWAIALDQAGNAHITGDTTSLDFPTANAIQPFYGGGLSDAFVSTMSANGSALLHSTYLGGSLFDEGRGIAVDGSGNIYVTGSTSSYNFPATPGTFQPQNGGGLEHHDDAFVARISAGAPAPSPAPAAPSALTAVAMSSSRIDLTWSDNSNDESGFQIERCQGSGCTGFVPIATTGVNGTSFSDNGLTAGAIFRYRVRAFSGNGSSESSNLAEATTLAASTAPAAPGNLSAASQASRSIDLRWNDNSGNESEFRIERCQGANCTNFVQVATAAMNATAYRDSNLNHNKAYRYRVRASNASGSSGYSNIAGTRPMK